MPTRRHKTKDSKQKFVLVTTLFFVLSLPFVLFGVVQKSLDTRSKAFEKLELSENNPCIISLPNVNPYTLEVGKKVRIQVDAKLKGEGIKKLNITDSTGEEIYTEDFEGAPLQIGTSFTITPKKAGTIDLLGNIETISGRGHGCKISSPFDIKGVRAIQNNSSPEFTSEPAASSKPSQDIQTGVQYEYTLIAKDIDKDRINYFYSFTPKASWLKDIVLEDGSDGKLKVTFKGTPNTPASYLANVVIHDGYSKNVRSQSWVINVGQSKNDIPIVKIIDPISSIRIDRGQEFKASWSVSDLNHIPTFDVFMSKNPTDEKTWIKIGDPLPYNVNAKNISTEGIPSGTYKLIVKATDNQKPPKSGIGVSPEIVVSKPSDVVPPTEDTVILSEPQVTNMSPSSTDEITNRRVTIKGTIVGSENTKIDEKSIQFKVDDQDVTENIKINKLSEREYTLIYQPDKDLEDGVHKAEIIFTDSSEKEVKKSWEFTIDSGAEKGDDIYRIFGKEISKKTLFIIGIGFLLIMVAICVPILISLIWGGGSKKEVETTTYSSRNVPAVDEFEEERYIPPAKNEEVFKKVNTVKPKEEETRYYDNYTAPKDIFVEQEENKPTEEDTTKVEVPIPELSTPQPTVLEEVEVKEEPVFKPVVHIQDTPKTDIAVKTDTKREEIAPPAQPELNEEPVFKPVVHIQDTPKVDIAVKTDTKIDEIAPPAQPELNEEPVFKPVVHIQDTPKVDIAVKTDTKTEEIAPSVQPEPNKEPVFKPIVHTQETETKITEPTIQETPQIPTEPPVQQPTPQPQSEIVEPEAPDPAIFQAIAAQIEAQQKEESNQTSPNTPA